MVDVKMVNGENSFSSRLLQLIQSGSVGRSDILKFSLSRQRKYSVNNLLNYYKFHGRVVVWWLQPRALVGIRRCGGSAIG